MQWLALVFVLLAAVIGPILFLDNATLGVACVLLGTSLFTLLAEENA